MRIVLLANGWVGLQVARFLREGDEPVGLVVHPTGAARLRDEIVEASGVGKDRVLGSDSLHEADAYETLRSWAPDLIVSAWYGYILKPRVLSLPSRGCVNLHPSYLPLNRGKFPNVWSIVDGTQAGATIHYIDEGVDTGDVILRRPVTTEPTDTGATLYERLERACVDVFVEVWPSIRTGNPVRTAQDDLPEPPTFHHASDVDGIDEIDLEETSTARSLLDLLRARTFPPHPSAYFVVDGRKIWVRLDLKEDDR